VEKRILYFAACAAVRYAGGPMKIRTALWMFVAARLVVAPVWADEASPKLLWSFETGG